jgi:hypothetical protein
MILAWDNPSTWRNTCPSVTFSNINHTWSGLVLNQCLLRDRPGTKYLNHLKWGSQSKHADDDILSAHPLFSGTHWHQNSFHWAKDTTLLACFWICLYTYGTHHAVHWPNPDNGVLPKWDFQQIYFYLAEQHKCTYRPDGPNHLNTTSVLLLKYPHSKPAMRLYCTTVTNTKNFFSCGSHMKKHQHPHSRPHKTNALVYPVQNKLLWSTNILPFNPHTVKFLDNSE